MGERGHTVHVRDGGAHDALRSAGPRVAVLGANERWTTFVPMNASTFECEHLSKLLDRAVLHAWFDEELGVVIQVYASGALVGELSLPGDEGYATEADRAFVRKLEDLDVVSGSQRATLLERMSGESGLHEWTMMHGLETLLELPFYEPLPPDVPEDVLRSLLPAQAIVLEPTRTGNKAKAAKSKARKPSVDAPSGPTPPPKAWWSDAERATLDLHCEYWGTVFSWDNWKLYNRYKKHLPADQRRDVDELCDAVAMGDDDKLAERVRSILARIWHRDDWDAVIRSPELIDGDADVWCAWSKRVSI